MTEEKGKIFTIDLKDPKMKPMELRMSRSFDLESFNPHGISVFTDQKNGNGTGTRRTRLTHTSHSTKSLHQQPRAPTTSDFELLSLTEKRHNTTSTHN